MISRQKSKGITGYLSRVLQAITGKAEIKPTTWVSGGGTVNKPKYFTERMRDKARLEKYRVIFEQGGIVAQAVISYADFALANGWRLESEDEALKQKVQDWLDYFDFNEIMWLGAVDALVSGDGFQENATNSSGDFVGLVPIDPTTMIIKYDKFGKVQQYEQHMVVDGVENINTLQPDQVTHIRLIPKSGSVYGISLLNIAFDDIMRDTKVAESTAVAIERHGFRKYQVKVGQEGEDIPQTVLEKIDEDFQELETKNDFVTNRDVDVLGLDQGTMEGVNSYSDWSLSRECAALGVPEEILGLRRGTTDATAVTRIGTYYKKVGAIQKKLERCYNINVIDRITGQPGAVKIVFNDVSPEDEKEKSGWIAPIMQSTPLDPFAVLPKKWIQEQFDIDEEYTDEQDKLDIIAAKTGRKSPIPPATATATATAPAPAPAPAPASVPPMMGISQQKKTEKAEQAKTEAERAYIAQKTHLLERLAEQWGQ